MECLSSRETERTTREANSVTKEVDLVAKVEFLKGKVESTSIDARGKGIQAGFKIFHQLTLQMQPDFNIKALEALVTPEIVGQAVNEVEEQVATLEIMNPVNGLGSS